MATCSIATIPKVGGMTQSALPLTEKMLDENPEYLEAIKLMAKRMKVSRYHSWIDLLLSELNPKLKKNCFDYYHLDEAPRLADMADEAILAYYDFMLTTALQVAYMVAVVGKKFKIKNWTLYRGIVLRVMENKIQTF